MAALAIHSKCFTKHACGGFCQLKFFQFVFPCESDVGSIAARARLSRQAFTEIIDNHVMKPGTTGGSPGKSRVGRENTIEHFYDLQDANLQSGLFLQFPRDTGLQGFAELQSASGNGPMAAKRFAGPANEQSAAFHDNDTANSDHGSFRIFSAHCELYFHPRG